VTIVTEESGIERTRLLKWILAWAGLSAAWFMNDNLPADDNLRADIDFEVARLVDAQLTSEAT
jgi:streptomycin 6-kinase